MEACKDKVPDSLAKGMNTEWVRIMAANTNREISMDRDNSAAVSITRELVPNMVRGILDRRECSMVLVNTSRVVNRDLEMDHSTDKAAMADKINSARVLSMVRNKTPGNMAEVRAGAGSIPVPVNTINLQVRVNMAVTGNSV